jgi:hypothetical protein
VCGSAASRGSWPAFLGRFPTSRWTRCALADGVDAGHVVVVLRLAKLRHGGGRRRRRGSERDLGPDTRNGARDISAQSCADSGTGHTCPQVADRTRAEGTRTRRPLHRQDARVDVRHDGHLPPGVSATSPRTCRQAYVTPPELGNLFSTWNFPGPATPGGGRLRRGRSGARGACGVCLGDASGIVGRYCRDSGSFDPRSSQRRASATGGARGWLESRPG